MIYMTRSEYFAKHEDFRGRINGTYYVLRYNPVTGDTELCPVTLT
jgi:hypothetical protein